MTDITPDLCDLHADLVRVLEPMLVNYGGCEAFSGEIVTVKCFEDNSLVKEQLNTPGADKVLVVDGGGSMRRALLGDMIAESAVKQGWQGVIIYGCIRDVSAISEMPLGVQAMACVPVKTEKRGIGDLNVPVCFGGVTFNPGEYVYADSNGVVVSAQPLALPG
ncbi:MAG TPA: putative 4-hydroxy-4-methyl-2-oxoglutarate aldolase [Porticoccaceae bacterium]|nr:putative 4-hydroxy-4-methyl-2-oxoglutarate aldolase [Porticoccaceae bacterium]